MATHREFDRSALFMADILPKVDEVSRLCFEAEIPFLAMYAYSHAHNEEGACSVGTAAGGRVDGLEGGAYIYAATLITQLDPLAVFDAILHIQKLLAVQRGE